jgi:hypothetical protein
VSADPVLSTIDMLIVMCMQFSHIEWMMVGRSLILLSGIVPTVVLVCCSNKYSTWTVTATVTPANQMPIGIQLRPSRQQTVQECHSMDGHESCDIDE